MAEEIFVFGAGGFGREVLDVIDAINAAARTPRWALVGVVDDSPSSQNLTLLRQRGTAHLGGVEDFLSGDPTGAYVIGIGKPQVRRMIAERLEGSGLRPATLIHPTATLGFGVDVGEGTVICAGVRLTTNICLGRHVNLHPNVTVAHDTTLGDFVSMNPASSLAGDNVIEDDVLISVGGVVLSQLRVGAGALIRGSACVTRDVPAGTTVKGGQER